LTGLCRNSSGNPRLQVLQTRLLDVQAASSGGSGTMPGTGREAHPAAGSVRASFVSKLALEDKQLRTLLVGNDSEVCPRGPTLEEHEVREAALCVERLVRDARNCS